MKKNILSAVLLIFFISASLSSCKLKNTEKKTDGIEKLSIVTTIFPQYDFAKNICGEFADISLLIPPGSEAHSFEPAPSDIIKLINADLFICVGGESEEWVNSITEASELSQEKILALRDIIDFKRERISSEATSEAEHEHEHEHENDPEYDEHVWTSVRNSEKICTAIYEKIIDIDPVHKEYYTKNYSAYTEKLKELDNTFSEITENATRNTIVFGDRFPFMYFANDYKLNYYAAFPGCASETEPSAATVAALTEKIKNDNIPVVFYIEFSNEKVADILCENTGAKKLLLHSCHNVTKSQLESNVSYLELMEKNAKNLREALN